MSKVLIKKLREALISVLPVTALVFLLNLTPAVAFSGREMALFAFSSLLLILGVALFNLGADLSMTPMGEHTGAGLARSGRLLPLLFSCFALGLLITVSEPDLSVLAAQVREAVNPLLLILAVGCGVGLFLLLSVLKTVFHKPLSALLLFFYLVIFALVAALLLRGGEKFLPLAFDSGGVTTGPITVPFLMAFGVGIAGTLGGRNFGENSFGLVALCSVGPVLAVLLLGLASGGDPLYRLPGYEIGESILSAFGKTALDTAGEILPTLGLIVLFFAVLQIFCLRLPKRTLARMAVGIGYTALGLILFLTAVTVGFMPVGYRLGKELAAFSPILTVLFGFLIGAVTVLAEPAVHVLNRQVEEITNGGVGRREMSLSLCAGIGVSVGLSMLRIFLGFNLLYYLIPGYLLSLGLSFFVPGIYTAIAFDSGGVASGPLTSGFLLPLAVGVCMTAQGEDRVLTDAFGIVATVAMTPLIAIQLLGFRAIVAAKLRERMAFRRILSADDEQIIDFQ